MPTSSFDDVRRLLVRRWDVGDLQEVKALASGWRVETHRGPLLLAPCGDLDRRQVLFQHEVTTALGAVGLPVAGPLPDRKGHTLVASGGLRYALYPWMQGRPLDGLELSLTQCGEVGGLLGRLHAALEQVAPPVQQALMVRTARAADTLAHADRLLAECRTGGFPPDEPARLLRRRELLAGLADHQPPDGEAFTTGYLHGDFHAGRLLFDWAGEVNAVLGWDRLHLGPIAGEVVRAAVLLFGREDLDLERIEVFVRGYLGEFTLDSAQVQSAVHRLWWEHLCDLDGDAALAEWWTGHLDETLDVFAAAYRPARPPVAPGSATSPDPAYDPVAYDPAAYDPAADGPAGYDPAGYEPEEYGFRPEDFDPSEFTLEDEVLEYAEGYP